MRMVIFGCGNIANRVAESCKLVDGLELVGFASKNFAKAQLYGRRYGCKDSGDYEHFLNDESIDAIYIATYNKSHYELIRQALEHHKNVMCEKPMVFSVTQNRIIFDVARRNDVLLMEALKSVFLPVNIKIKEIIENKGLGELEEVSASFMRNGTHGEDHWINDLETGGAFKDLGSYCVGTLNYIMGRPGELVSLQSDRTYERAETTAYADLVYGNVRAKVAVSNSLDGDLSLRLKGSRGTITVENFWKNNEAAVEIDGEQLRLHEELISDFYYELKHFQDLVKQGKKESDIMSERASENILQITSLAGE